MTIFTSSLTNRKVTVAGSQRQCMWVHQLPSPALRDMQPYGTALLSLVSRGVGNGGVRLVSGSTHDLCKGTWVISAGGSQTENCTLWTQ